MSLISRLHDDCKFMLKSTILSILTLSAIASLLILGACASHKKNFFSKTYHNTTAKYNAYFIAKENIHEVEEAVATSHKNNYDKILGVFYDIDSATIDGVRPQLDDAIVKASLSIQRHENSNWVYPSYYLVGKARYYGGDFVNAIETFKYINKHSEEKDIRHEALVALMRAFIDYKEQNNAIAVADFLRKENLSKENMQQFLLTRAYLFHLREDYDNMVRSLSQAVEIEPTKRERARYYFILGQIYQHLGFEGEAYNNYRKCLKSNPDFELSFYAKLNLAQVTKLDQKVDLKKIRGYFTKLLKDDKNREFIDRIYYEMANFEIKHDDPDLAVEYLKSSVSASVNNPRQKGHSFLRLGELYYDLYKDYQLAQAYYDSTASVLPQDEERYQEVKDRAAILNDFVEQLNTIHLQDSLLALADMPKGELQAYLEGVIERQQELEKQQEREARKLARQTNSAGSGTMQGGAFANPFGIDQNSPSEGSTWYFYNLAAVGTGRSQFLTKWGNRPLADNWRRSQRQAELVIEEEAVVDEDTVDLLADELAGQNLDEEDPTAGLKATIPFSEEEQAAANKLIEDAYYKLGNIYNFQLEEDENAIDTYEKLLTRYPGSEYEPETLYLLYLQFKSTDEAKSIGYKQRLIGTYPKSLYAKLAENPNYREESNETAQRLQRLYKIAYDYYLQEDFNQAKLLVSRGLQQYPDNEFSDQLRILGILIDGKLEGQYKYQYELQKFIEDYPESTLLDYATGLLQTSRDFETKEMQRKGAQYLTDFEQPHFFIFVYPNVANFAELIPALIERHIQENFSDLNLKTGNLSLNDESSLVLVNKFESHEMALEFYEKFNSADLMLPQLDQAKYENYIITEDNFQILYQVKETEAYQKFFDEQYIP